MPDSLNRLEPDGPTPAVDDAGTPDRVRRRYLAERRDGGLAYFVDATIEHPAFRDQGRRLSTDRNDPVVIRDLIAIAAHRGWSRVAVRGHTDFRREAWRAARLAGLEVVGYRPTERDRQDLERRTSAQRARPPDAAPSPSEALAVAEAVVRARIVEPGERDRLLRNARARVTAWIARSRPAAQPERTPERSRV